MRAAVKKGSIVLAAAGDCVRLVVYPARYDEVIAVAGVNGRISPGSDHAAAATSISAPAELVWRADKRRVGDPTTNVGGGQGTSFAVALTAGVAALWLSHHGRDAVRAEAFRRGVTVQALFKTAMQATCRKPAIWDSDDFGPGIVDAELLLGLALGAIPQAAPEAAAPRTAESVKRLLDDAGGARNADPEFDWKRYGLEVASMLFEDSRFGGAGPVSVEAAHPACAPLPSLPARRKTLPTCGCARSAPVRRAAERASHPVPALRHRRPI